MTSLSSRVLECPIGTVLIKLGDGKKREIMEDGTGERRSQARKLYGPISCHSHWSELGLWQLLIPKDAGIWSPPICSGGRYEGNLGAGKAVSATGF